MLSNYSRFPSFLVVHSFELIILPNEQLCLFSSRLWSFSFINEARIRSRSEEEADSNDVAQGDLNERENISVLNQFIRILNDSSVKQGEHDEVKGPCRNDSLLHFSSLKQGKQVSAITAMTR
jgi:hypothetical protein